jgi:hypothetical protein
VLSSHTGTVCGRTRAVNNADSPLCGSKRDKGPA